MPRSMGLLALITVLLTPSAGLAQTPSDCGGLWREADVDANGSLTRDEDAKGFIDAFRAGGRTTLTSEVLSRDEFMLFCEGDLRRSSATTRQHKGTQGPIDRGKGDLTPGLIPFPKDEAMKRLQATGYRDVGELVLDDKGIWRGTANFGGKQVPVSVDVQGDVLAGG